MADIASPPPLYAGKTDPAQPAAPTDAQGRTGTKDMVSSDFETFLKMLTVQVQNQDPLNPVDSTDYATQLATFSSVEQQVLTNDLLKEMGSLLGGNALQGMSEWIGMEGLVRAPAYFDGAPVSIRPDYAEEADAAVLVVRDSSDAVIQRFDLDVSKEEIVWGGADSNGNLLPDGSYRFEVQSYKGEEQIGTATAPVYSRIAEVREEDGGLIVRMSDGTELDPALITGLRTPAG